MTATFLNKTVTLVVTNKTGGSVAKGDVLALSTTDDKAVISTTTVSYLTTPVVVALEPAAADEKLSVALEGYVPRINLNYSSSRMDRVKTSSTAKQGALANAGDAGSFARVLGTGTAPEAELFGVGITAGNPGIADGRLTLTSGTPVTTSDVTGATTLYYALYKGNRLALYDGAVWRETVFTEKSISLSSTSANTNYDVFGYLDSAGALALELLAWSSGTARATALTRQDGAWVKSGDATRRYLGTIRTTSAGECEDSGAKRLVWNVANRILRKLKRLETAISWTYGSTTIRQANANTANQVEVVVGLAEVGLDLSVCVLLNQNTGSGFGAQVGIGEDSLTVISSECVNPYVFQLLTGNATAGRAELKKYPAIGYHYYAWLEAIIGSGTAGFYGEPDTGYVSHSGLTGWIEG